MNLRNKVLQIAINEGYGIKEIEGQNKGPQVRKYLSFCGFSTPEPWCAAFVSWCMKQALKEKFDKAFIVTADTWALDSFAYKNNILEIYPEVGDVFLKYNYKGATHTGFVLSLIDKTNFKTVEGNSNTNGSSNGDGIYSLTRSVTDSFRFIKWWKLIDIEEENFFTLIHNDKVVAKMPLIDNKAYAPIRELSEILNFKMRVDGKNKKIYI